MAVRAVAVAIYVLAPSAQLGVRELNECAKTHSQRKRHKVRSGYVAACERQARHVLLPPKMLRHSLA